MISNEISMVQLKDADRAWLAEAVKNYAGPITVIERPLIRLDQPKPYANGLVLPGSSTVDKLGRQIASSSTG